MASLRSGCDTGAPPVPVVEITIQDVHNQLINGSLTCAQLAQAYLQVEARYCRISVDSALVLPETVCTVTPEAQFRSSQTHE